MVKRRVAQPGDVYKIPVSGKFVLAIVVSKNSFGTAFAFVDKVFNDVPDRLDRETPLLKHPIYSDEKLLRDGQWIFVFNDESILEKANTQPEIYHSPDMDPEYGPYGLAEAPNGKLRKISKEEADEVGLLVGGYHQAMMPDEIEQSVVRDIVGS
ncbi:MAG: hypothetical protein WED10_14175 [Brumimicrobium sp.]